jgi:hypothetical protein
MSAPVTMSTRRSKTPSLARRLGYHSNRRHKYTQQIASEINVV